MATGNKRQRRERQRTNARERAEKHGSGFDRTSFQVPEGKKLWMPEKEGVYRIDILPYQVTLKGNPNADPGFDHYERTFYVHRGIGAEENSYLCLASTFKKKCPICDDRAEMKRRGDADDALIKSLLPKERQLFNLFDLNDPESGFQLWEISYHLFGKHLDKKVKLADKDDDGNGEYDNFHYHDDGLMLRIGAEQKSFDGNSFLEFNDIEFKARKKQYDDSVFEEVADLDALIAAKELSYDKLQAIYLQSGADDDSGDDDDGDAKPAKRQSIPPKKSSGKKPVADDDDDPAAAAGIEVGSSVEHDDYGVCEVKHVSSDGTSLRIEDSDGEIHKSIDTNDVTLVDADDDGDDAPPPKANKAKPKPSKSKPKPVADDDDGDDDGGDSDDDDGDDDGDVPPPKSKPKAGSRAGASTTKRTASARDDDDGDDDGDDDDGDDAPPPRSKPKASGKKKPAPVDDDDDGDSDADDDNGDDDDDDPPAPRRNVKSLGKAAKGKRPPVEDDEDDD